MKGFKYIGDELFVSRGGRIWSDRSHQFIATQARQTVSYYGQSIYNHQLIAMAFCDKPAGATVVHHINGDPSDNSAKNLVWLTPEQHAQVHAEMLDMMREMFNRKGIRKELQTKIANIINE